MQRTYEKIQWTTMMSLQEHEWRKAEEMWKRQEEILSRIESKRQEKELEREKHKDWIRVHSAKPEQRLYEKLEMQFIEEDWETKIRSI